MDSRRLWQKYLLNHIREENFSSLIIIYFTKKNKAGDIMKLSKKLNGNKQLSGYLASIKLTEARDVGFVDNEDNPKELEKIIDIKNKQIIIQLKKDEN